MSFQWGTSFETDDLLLCNAPCDFQLAVWCFLQRSPTVIQLRETLKKREATNSKEEEELTEGGQEAPCSYLTDTYCDLLGYTSPYIYDQSELTTTERRINQIYMLQVGPPKLMQTNATPPTVRPRYKRAIYSLNANIYLLALPECRI